VFEVNPAVVGQPVSLFTYINSSGTTSTTFPNGVGSESGHADGVAWNFYGATNGVAPEVNHVDNYEVNWFIGHFVANKLPIPARVVNQSFANNVYDPAMDQIYDDYAVT